MLVSFSWATAKIGTFCLTALRNTITNLIVPHYWTIDNFKIHLLLRDMVVKSNIRADQNTGSALLEFSMRTAMHETSRVCLEYLFAIIRNFASSSSLLVIVQTVRRWTIDHGYCKV